LKLLSPVSFGENLHPADHQVEKRMGFIICAHLRNLWFQLLFIG